MEPDSHEAFEIVTFELATFALEEEDFTSSSRPDLMWCTR